MAMPDDPQAAFRAGVLGWRFGRMARADPGASPGYAFGPNEALVMGLARLPGLAGARPAFECGRALRAITKLLDRAAAPGAVGRQFLDNLTAACVAHRSRRGAAPWAGEDTIAMFMELYARIMEPSPAEAATIEAALLAYARDDQAALPGTHPARIRGAGR